MFNKNNETFLTCLSSVTTATFLAKLLFWFVPSYLTHRVPPATSVQSESRLVWFIQGVYAHCTEVGQTVRLSYVKAY